MIKDQKFLDMVVSRVKERVAEACEVEVRHVLKNNGTVMTGISIRKNGLAVAPVVYLEQGYHEFCGGKDADEIIEEIWREIPGRAEEIEALLPDIYDFPSLCDRVVFRLLNRDANREMLKNVPYVEICDLAVVFGILVRNEEGEIWWTEIRREYLEWWQVSVEELYQTALTNTPRLLPATLQTLHSVMMELTKERLGEEAGELWGSVLWPSETKEVYVLSNKTRTYGASSVLYPGRLHEAAEKMESDLLVIPSSLHEVLLFQYDEEDDPDTLRNMVYGVNRECVPVEERLSDQVYIYRRATGQLELAEE